SRWHVERTNRCFYKVWRKSRAIVREVIWEIRGKAKTIMLNGTRADSLQLQQWHYAANSNTGV
ncbi:MAG: hypothetical protein SH868_08135, partial [Bythopirellula sp.]|nr:hypothetical protein [Bythopirellula sp.]